MPGKGRTGRSSFISDTSPARRAGSDAVIIMHQQSFGHAQTRAVVFQVDTAADPADAFQTVQQCVPVDEQAFRGSGSIAVFCEEHPQSIHILGLFYPVPRDQVLQCLVL